MYSQNVSLVKKKSLSAAQRVVGQEAGTETQQRGWKTQQRNWRIIFFSFCHRGASSRRVSTWKMLIKDIMNTLTSHNGNPTAFIKKKRDRENKEK